MAPDHHHYHAFVRRVLSIRSVADCLPWFFNSIVTNGKIAAAALIAVYLALLGLGFPFWLLSFVVTEYGVYFMAIASIFLIGRGIIRLIAFPGASRKVVQDMETEFAKYSVRMIENAAASLIDVATVFLEQQGGDNGSPRNSNAGYQLPSLWRRVKSFRDRVLGVFVETLLYLYEQDSTNSLSLSVDVNHSNGNTATNSSASVYGPGLTRYGNNRFTGDIGSFALLSTKARLDGHELLNRLQNVLRLVDDLEANAKSILEGGVGTVNSTTVTEPARAAANQLRDAANELRDFVSSLRPAADDDDGDAASEDPTDAVRRRMEEQQNSTNAVDAVKMALSSILPMLDPPPHLSIFGFDVQRGCMLSRYCGARQLWVRRPTGGMIDVLHFPAAGQQSPAGHCNREAVLYCNPNAGLIEVAAGMSFNGGNVPTADPDNANDDSWIDYYTQLGLDVYVFNYAGYGRSYGTTMCVRDVPASGDQYPGILARIGRILKSVFFSFTPTPDTLRGDGVAVAQHLISSFGVQQLVIHGESIGGMAAAGTARCLSESSTFRSQLSLLICDRTFCNLEAVAQRLVGGWTGYAIRGLAPFWNTDVAGDFLESSCPKIVASDNADVIISDAASLKSGIALWKELHRGIATTKGIGWIPETPLQYRMADWENVCVNDTRYTAGTTLFRAQPPVWPTDKHVSLEEAFHFAACCKRIGKFAKAASMTAREDPCADNVAQQSLIIQAWVSLGCCDGLTGATLGVATKRGFDATVSWLCSCLVFGGQVVSERGERRMQQQQGTVVGLEIVPSDFDGRPQGFQQREEESSVMFPKPIPAVLESLVAYLEIGDETMVKLSHEFQFVVGVLHYVQARLSAPTTIQAAQQTRQFVGCDGSAVGKFMNLHCGHNNPFSREERQNLKILLDRATSNSPTNELV